MGWHSLALAACGGWILLGQWAGATSAAGAELAGLAPQWAAEAEATAQPLQPIPAGASQPTPPLVPIPAEQSVPRLLPSQFRQPTSDLPPATSPAATALREVAADPAELVAQALALPADETLAGHPARLQDLLARTVDGQQRQELIAAYWRLAAALAEYNFCCDYQAQVDRWHAHAQARALSPAAAARWKAAAAMAQARSAAAEAALVEQQHVVAALARLGPSDPLPLPADQPYTGPYRTYFRELFPGGVGPGRTRLIDQTLPLDQQAIEHYAAAVAAAEEALAAAAGPEGAEATTAADALQLLERRYQQQGVLIEAVVNYNRQIAEYALAVAPPGIDAARLVAMLIKSQPVAAQPSPSGGSSAVRPAVAEEQLPVPSLPTRAVLPPGSLLPAERSPAQPGEALPPNGARPPGEALPGGGGSSSAEIVPPGEARPLSNSSTPTEASAEISAPSGPERSGAAARPMLPVRPMVPVDPPAELPAGPPAEPAENARDEPIAPGADADGAWPGRDRSDAPDAGSARGGGQQPAAALGGPQAGGSLSILPAADQAGLVLPALYGALEKLAPEQQAVQLAALLNWDRMLSGKGQPMDLLTALRTARPGERQAVVESFWQVRRRAAEYQLRAESLPWYEELGLVLQAEGVQREPAVLRQARHHAAGAAKAAEARLLAAQYDLAVRLGQASDWPWPLPSTPPHAGQYAVRLDMLPPELAASWPVRGLAESIARSHRCLVQQAAVVVAADQARSAAAAAGGWGTGSKLAGAGCRAGDGSLVAAVVASSAQGQPFAAGESASALSSLLAVVEATELQVQATVQFLAALTDYNAAIAGYALTALPPSASAEEVLSALAAVP